MKIPHTGDTNSLGQCREKHRYQLNKHAVSQFFFTSLIQETLTLTMCEENSIVSKKINKIHRLELDSSPFIGLHASSTVLGEDLSFSFELYALNIAELCS